MHKYISLGLGISLTFALAGCHGGSPASQTSKATASPPAPPRTVAAATTAGQPATSEQPAASTAASPAVSQDWAKLTPELTAMVKQVQAAPDGSAAHALSNSRIHVNAKKQIQIYIYVNHVDAATESHLAQTGAAVGRGIASMKVYQAWASPNALQQISRLPDVVRITPPAYGFPK